MDDFGYLGPWVFGYFKRGFQLPPILRIMRRRLIAWR